LKVIIASIGSNRGRLITLAKRNGFDPVFVSALKIVWLDISKELAGCLSDAVYSWAIFASTTAASLFLGHDRLVRSLKGARVAAVGSGTASFLRRRGLKVDFVPSEYTTERLAEELPADPGSRVLILRSEDGSHRAEEMLITRGIIPCRLDLYRTSFVDRPLKSDRIQGAKIVIFGSSKEVMGLENRLSISGISEFKKSAIAASIGPLTRDTAMKMGYRVIDIPKAYTYRSLFELLGELKLEGRI
jgi:uroporphyrinogen-III synthase